MNKAQSRHVEMSLSPWHMWPKELPGTALFLDAPSRISVPSHRPSLPLLSLPASLPLVSSARRTRLCGQRFCSDGRHLGCDLRDCTTDARHALRRPLRRSRHAVRTPAEGDALLAPAACGAATRALADARAAHLRPDCGTVGAACPHGGRRGPAGAGSQLPAAAQRVHAGREAASSVP